MNVVNVLVHNEYDPTGRHVDTMLSLQVTYVSGKSPGLHIDPNIAQARMPVVRLQTREFQIQTPSVF